MEAIKAEGLTKYYGKARGIVGLDLCVEQGEFFGFIGPNGAGKSTTIRTLLGLMTIPTFLRLPKESSSTFFAPSRPSRWQSRSASSRQSILRSPAESLKTSRTRVPW